MSEILWLEPRDPRWMEVLEAAAAYDIYHCPEYHTLAAERGGGEPRLLVCRDGAAFLALPLLLRPIPSPPGGARLLDATSVYGYPGPLRSPELDGRALRAFTAAIPEQLATRRVVTVFSRLNPLLDQAPLLAGLGTLHRHGATVSIDLTLSPDAQLAGYRANHRRDLRALRAMGYVCREGREKGDLAAFADAYAETMRRVGAGEDYAFGLEDLRRLHDALGDRVTLALCEVGGEPAAGGLFLRQGPIAQYHLGGTRDRHLRSAPMKLVMDFARAHFHAAGASLLHLGGGLGGREDSLFAFKAGFSNRRHEFFTWRWVVRPDDHARLCRERGAEPPAESDGYFPAYRRPAATVAAEPALAQ